MESIPKAFYTLTEIAEITHLSARTIRDRIAKGLIPKATFSGKILVPAWWVNQAIEGSETNSRSN